MGIEQWQACCNYKARLDNIIGIEYAKYKMIISWKCHNTMTITIRFTSNCNRWFTSSPNCCWEWQLVINYFYLDKQSQVLWCMAITLEGNFFVICPPKINDAIWCDLLVPPRFWTLSIIFRYILTRQNDFMIAIDRKMTLQNFRLRQ